MIASAEIGIEAGRQHFCEHADDGAAAMHPAHEAWMDIAGRVRRDASRELPIDVSQVRRASRQAALETRPDRVRNRLPDRPLANAGDMIDHVVEHAMSEYTDLVPVLRIERLAGLGFKPRLAKRLGHAARSPLLPTRRASIATNASKILRICGPL